MDFEKLKIPLLALLTLLAGTTYVDATGYNVFDAEDDRNPLCELDPACRPLTEGEAEIARQYFGNDIPYEKVRIFSRAFTPSRINYNGMMSPNGHIYYGASGEYADDISKYPDKIDDFLHEMTHVWRHYQGTNLPLAAAIETIKHRFNYDSAYDYDLNTTNSFDSLGIEQQAKIIEDYVELQQGFNKAGYHREQWLKNNCEKIKEYEDKISESMPLKRLEDCSIPPLSA